MHNICVFTLIYLKNFSTFLVNLFICALLCFARKSESSLLSNFALFLLSYLLLFTPCSRTWKRDCIVTYLLNKTLTHTESTFNICWARARCIQWFYLLILLLLLLLAFLLSLPESMSFVVVAVVYLYHLDEMHFDFWVLISHLNWDGINARKCQRRRQDTASPSISP